MLSNLSYFLIPSNYLILPKEIRDLIYANVLLVPAKKIWLMHKSSLFHFDKFNVDLDYTYSLPSIQMMDVFLLFLSKQINQEALRAFFLRTHLLLSLSSWSATLSRISVPLRYLTCIKSLTVFTYDSDSVTWDRLF